MLVITPADGENAVLDRIGGEYRKFSEMSLLERQFLNSLVLRHKPKKILELGVSAGASAVIILNSIRDDDGAVLHSVDYSRQYYRNPSLRSGFVVDAYPDLRAKHRLHTGGLALEFMEEIGGGIDFCFIDTKHRLPGEVLDYLMVLPYLKPDCVVVFHDTQLHTSVQGRNCIATCLMMSAVKGEKMGCVVPFDPRNFETGVSRSNDGEGDGESNMRVFANIGGVRLTGDAAANAWDVFNLLTLPWDYSPPEDDIRKMDEWFSRHYGADEAVFFRHAAVYQEYSTAVRELGAIQNFDGMPRLLFGLKHRSRELFYWLRSKLAKRKRREKYAHRAAKLRARRGELLRIQKKYA